MQLQSVIKNVELRVIAQKYRELWLDSVARLPCLYLEQLLI